MKLPYVIACLYFLSCKSEPKLIANDKADHIRINFVESIKKFDSTLIIDSFRVVRLDTLTEAYKYTQLYTKLADRLGTNNEIATSLIKSRNAYIELDNIGSQVDAGTSFKSIVADKQEEIEKVIKESKIISVQIDTLRNRIANANPAITNLLAVSFYQYRKSDMSITRDTFYTLLTLNHDVLDYNDMLKDALSELSKQ